MLIMRTRDGLGNVKTFAFSSRKNADKAFEEIAETGVAVFLANADSITAKSGKILVERKLKSKFCFLSQTVVNRAYSDHIWRTFGTREECMAESEKINAKVEGWWSVHAKAFEITETLWAVDHIDPYKD